MAELIDRLRHEAELQKVLQQLTSAHAEQLRDYLNRGVPFSEIPREFWDAMKADIKRDDDNKAALLLLIFGASAVQHLRTIPKVKAAIAADASIGVGDGIAAITSGSSAGSDSLSDLTAKADALGQRYVTSRLNKIAGPYVRHSRDMIRRAIRDKPEDPSLHPEWVDETIDKVTGPDRVKRLADTEANLSMIGGGASAVKVAKIAVIKFWAHSKLRPPRHSNAPKDKCPLCSPLEGKAESEWGGAEPGKIHPNCDCYIAWVDEYGHVIGEEDSDSDTFERFKDRLPAGFLKPREQLFLDHPELLESLK